MHTRVEPALSRWQPAHAGDAQLDTRRQLKQIVNARANRLGLPLWGDARLAPVIATGHQAAFWHPGILAKDIAGAVAAEAHDAMLLHLVVDQDAHEALTLDVPRVQSDLLEVEQVQLAEHATGVPTGWQPPVPTQQVRESLQRLGDRGAALREAWKDIPTCRTLAEQVAVVLSRLMRPYAGPMPIVLTSDLLRLDAYERIVAAMRRDARHCAETYNAVVDEHPSAGVTPLAVRGRLVELPLWAVRWNQPRGPVFADVAGPGNAEFVDAAGMPFDDDVQFAPRALLLTAVMRSLACDLFVHGTGGWTYDRVTESWWRRWRGEELSPMTLATADVHLPFDAPIADERELRRAQWYCHHAPHNVNRLLNLNDSLARQKQQLLAHMDDDRDKARRRRAFEQVHAINETLCREHPHVIAQADRRLRQAETGVTNARIARRRDWCFALYPPERLHALREALEPRPHVQQPAPQAVCCGTNS